MPLPTEGTITFLFTDIVGSTRLWEAFPEAMRAALAIHDTLLQREIESHGGYVFKTVGDAFCAAFASTTAAVETAVAIHLGLRNLPAIAPDFPPLRVRIGIHCGQAEVRDNDYFGPTVNRVARLLSAGHGEQILLSQTGYALIHASLPETIHLLDRGIYLLKDLQAPEHIYQVQHSDLPSDFPPLNALNPAITNLPVQTTTFIGRQKEIADIQRLMTATRLLTLTGSGGTGKTRLAQHVAAEQTEQQGIWQIELGPVHDPALVPLAVASVLNLREEPNRPLMQTLLDYLKDRSTLLLLDNCEHLLLACAQLAEAILRHCPKVRLLVTSREALGISGEQTYRVPSLSLPPVTGGIGNEDLLKYEAVRLFVERAVLVKSDFLLTRANSPVLARLCNRLDGIPLALELAAARVRAMPVEQIETRLNDRFRLLTGGSKTTLPQQQTLRALIDWSYDLLTLTEKALLTRLSVFSGGWTLEAAEQVTPGPIHTEGEASPEVEIEEWEVLDLLTALVDKSLVVYDEGAGHSRYRLLETVRQYATEKLTANAEWETFRAKHRDCYLRYVDEHRKQKQAPAQEDVLTAFDREQDNLRMAIECALEEEAGSAAEPPHCLRFVTGLYDYWYRRGLLAEGRHLAERACDFTRKMPPTGARGKLLRLTGNLAWAQGDLTAAEGFYRESLAIVLQGDQKLAIADVYYSLSMVLISQHQFAEAHEFVEQALPLYQEEQDKGGMASCYNEFGLIAAETDDAPVAFAWWEKALSLYRELNDTMGSAAILVNMGVRAKQTGQYEQARQCLLEALDIHQKAAFRYGIAYIFENLAALAAAEQKPERAAHLFGAFTALFEAMGAKMPPVASEKIATIVAELRQTLGETAFETCFAAGQAFSLEESCAFARKG